MLPDRLSNPGPLTYESGALLFVVGCTDWSKLLLEAYVLTSILCCMALIFIYRSFSEILM